MRKRICPKRELPRVEKILYRLARNYSCPPLITYDDALSEAYLAFMKACQTYSCRKRAKFSTWCFIRVRGQLLHYRKKKFRDRKLVYVEIKDDLFTDRLCDDRRLLDRIDDELSQDARDLLGLILDTPQEILEHVPRTPKQFLSRLAETVGYNRGWDSEYFAITLHEIKERFASS